ncbi:MAG: deoxyribose-phosphate aldolase [Paludibacteraceae bacterium]|nr:deoxyribose-phosphate aldolase [Paludibacteraceae bacterium]
MDKFEELFATYPLGMSDEQVKEEVARLLREHSQENNNVEVWKQCLSQIDLTTLNGDDTEAKVRTMAEKVNGFQAAFPGLPNVASICVYPALVPIVKEHLKAEGVGITSVAGGFPASQTFIEVKVAEVGLAVAEGATEVDIVLSQGKFLEGKYEECFDEIAEQKAAARDAHFKVILETGALQTADNIAKASVLAMAAGADFIKTSTGKIAVAATPEASYVMCRMIKMWYEKTGEKICFKPAGGVSTTEEAVAHYTIVKEVLGQEWLNNHSFRFGASRLANNILSSIQGETVKYS